MKKILFFALFAFAFTSCSTDDTGLTETENNGNFISATHKKLAPANECFKSITAYNYLDLSNGFDNPMLVFIGDVTVSPSTPNKRYSVKIELQPLSDCDDFNSVTGSPVFYYAPGLITNLTVNKPIITLTSSQFLSGCYKWRMICELTTSTQATPVCTSATEWYDAPLF